MVHGAQPCKYLTCAIHSTLRFQKVFFGFDLMLTLVFETVQMVKRLDEQITTWQGMIITIQPYAKSMQQEGHEAQTLRKQQGSTNQCHTLSDSAACTER